MDSVIKKSDYWEKVTKDYPDKIDTRTEEEHKLAISNQQPEMQIETSDLITQSKYRIEIDGFLN